MVIFIVCISLMAKVFLLCFELRVVHVYMCVDSLLLELFVHITGLQTVRFRRNVDRMMSIFIFHLRIYVAFSSAE